MQITRRRFLQGTAVAGGAALAHGFLFGGLETLAATDPLSVAAPIEDVVPTTCWIGKQDCGMLARRVDGRVVKFEGLPAHPRNQGTLCPKGQAQIMALYDPNRLKTPLIRTNEKGRSGTWREATWPEALALVADRVNEVRARNPKLVLWQKGRSKAKSFYDTAFVKSIGATKLGHGAYCSDTGYRALEYTIGLHGVLHPDFQHTNYLLAWGWNITNAGGNKLCWITWPQQMVRARERGMKIVHVDPRLRSAGPFADVWLPIRPGTDLALALGLCNVLIEEGFVDAEYLTRFTNAPYLVGEDGLFLRLGESELVWDGAAGRAVPATEATAPALEGTYEVQGGQAKTAFQLFKEQVAQYPPEWAADLTGLPAAAIRSVGREFGENALIGSTIVVGGVEVPHRPVAIMAYHMAQQELGFQTLRAMTMVSMLVGAVGAVGGQLTDFTWKIHKNYEKLDNVEIKDPPYDFTLKDSKFFPINTGFPGIVAQVMLDPGRYGVEELPEVAILHMVNPLVAFPDQRQMMESYAKFRFVTVISPWLSETADYFADVVLPAATIEKYEGPHSATDQYLSAVALRLPPMDPLFDSKGEIDIYMDLAEAMGVLYGEGGYLEHVNKALKLEESFALPLDRKPDVRDIFDRWARSQGIDEGIAYFEENGVMVKGPVAPTKRYGYAVDPPFGGALHRFYGESLLRYQRAMRNKGADEIYWRDYVPLPRWRTPTMEASPAQYDLYLLSYKQVENKQARTSFVPLLAELDPDQHVDINPEAARARGIGDGEEVWVESHNAITGETRRIRTVAVYSEGIRPDTVAMPHHFGLWTHPTSADRRMPSPNEIFYTGEGYMVNTADQSFHVKVSVYPAGGEA
jgi:anaerobic selenocysteine-containing dehydrogenase